MSQVLQLTDLRLTRSHHHVSDARAQIDENTFQDNLVQNRRTNFRRSGNQTKSLTQPDSVNTLSETQDSPIDDKKQSKKLNSETVLKQSVQSASNSIKNEKGTFGSEAYKVCL